MVKLWVNETASGACEAAPRLDLSAHLAALQTPH